MQSSGASAPPTLPEPAEGPTQRFTIRFDDKKAALTPGGIKAFDAAVAAIRTGHRVEIAIEGCGADADRTDGSACARRAMSVRRLLAQRGVADPKTLLVGEHPSGSTTPAPNAPGSTTPAANIPSATTPVPDIVAIAATSDPGYVDLPAATGAGVFAVVTTNKGGAGTITVTANTGAGKLPLSIVLCQTNPATSVCLAAAQPSITLTMNANDKDAFAVFVGSVSVIPDKPAANRVFVTFTDAGNALRGETSIAVRTH